MARRTMRDGEFHQAAKGLMTAHPPLQADLIEQKSASARAKERP